MIVMIRKADISEDQMCAELIRRAFADVAQKFSLTMENCPSNPDFITADRIHSIAEKGGELFVYELAGEPVGFAAVVPAEKGAFELEKLCVLPEFRERGIGSLLIKHCAKTAADRGADVLKIGIIKENTILKRWYEKNGFVFTGTAAFKTLPFTVGFMELRL